MPSSLLDLKEIILKILSKSPKHGYQLAKEISEQLELNPSLGGLYPILKDLETNGLILGHEIVEYGHFKKVYSLTTKGKEEVAKIEKRFSMFRKFMEKE